MTQQPQQSREVDKFLGLIDKFADLLDAAQLNLIAYKSGDRWISLSALVKIGGAEAPETTLNVRDKLLVLSVKIETNELATLLKQIVREQMLHSSSYNIYFSGIGPFRLQQRVGQLYFYSTPYDTRYEPGPKSAVLLSSMAGSSVDNIVGQDRSGWDGIDEALQTFNPPYQNLADLAESYLGYPIGPGHSTTLYGLLLLPFKVLEADVGKGGTLELKLSRDPRSKPDDVIFGVIVKQEAGAPIRASVPLTSARVMNTEKDLEVVQLDISLAGFATVTLHLSVRGELLSTTILYPGMSSPRLRCHKILDPDVTILEKALTDKGGRPFEDGVVMLLHLAGFKVEIAAVLESLASERYADILAFTPDEKIIVVGACVFKNPTPQDLTLLEQSYLTTKATLSDSALTIIPVMFTSMLNDTVSGSLRQQAQSQMIQFVAREQLLQALKLVKSGAGPNEVLKTFGYWIW